MKVQELLEAKESIYKKMARENRERIKKEREAGRAEEKTRKVAQKDSKKADKAKLDDELYNKVMNAIHSSFPDLDPIDKLANYFVRHNLTLDDVDRVLKKRDKITYDKLLQNMWDEACADAVSYANGQLERGKTPEHSSFYFWKKGDKKVTPDHNPWK